MPEPTPQPAPSPPEAPLSVPDDGATWLEHTPLEPLHGMLNRPLFELGQTSISLQTILTVMVVMVLAWQLSRVLQRATAAAFHRRDVTDEATVSMVQRLLHYLVLSVALMTALQTAGIDLSSLLAAGAVFAVGFGLAMQSIAQNFVSGIILLIERTIRPGDVLHVNGRMVRVVEMSVRNTIVRTRDGEGIIVPNSLLAQDSVTNYSVGHNPYRLSIRVGVHYDSDLKQVRRVLLEVAGRQPLRISDRAPEVVLRDFADSAVLWDVCYWIEDPWMVERGRDALREATWDAFKEHGIVIAFPQLDLHLDARSLEALRSRSDR